MATLLIVVDYNILSGVATGGSGGSMNRGPRPPGPQRTSKKKIGQ